MEEVDNIIIQSLKQIGCEVDDGVESLKQFDTEMVVMAAVRCLKTMKPELDLPNTLSPSMSVRFRTAGKIAEICQELGYKGEIGYQTFLYSNENEIRKVLGFLLEKIPKEVEKSSDEPLGRSGDLEGRISQAISTSMSKVWSPPYCKRADEGYSQQEFSSASVALPSDYADILKSLPKETMRYYASQIPFISQQAPKQKVLPSVVNWHEERLAKQRSSRQDFKKKRGEENEKKVSEILCQDLEKCKVDSYSGDVDSLRRRVKEVGLKRELKDTEEEKEVDIVERKPPDNAEVKKEELISKLQEEANLLREKMESTQTQVKRLTNMENQLEMQIRSKSLDLKEKERRYATNKRTYALLPDAEANITKLRALVEQTSQRLVTLAQQWEKHRSVTIEEYRQKKGDSKSRHCETQKQTLEVVEMESKIKQLVREARRKDEFVKVLKTEWEKMSKDANNRWAYTRRIAEIIASIKKQNEEIDRVLVQTKQMHKDINHINGMLDRTFTVTDELIFRDAKKDKEVRKAYKLLATLHSECAELVKVVEETGAITREIRDLEDQFETENSKRVSANLERITADLQQMKHENAALMVQLKNTA